MSDDETECERLGHDDTITFEDEEAEQWECARCGAEWWEDKEPTP